MRDNEVNPVVGFFLVAGPVVLIGWVVWFYTMVPVYEGKMYVQARSWSRTIHYIHRWQTTDCGWETRSYTDINGNVKEERVWNCDTNTHYETLRSWTRTGDHSRRPYWPEHPAVEESWNYYLEYHEGYYLSFRSNDLNRSFTWTVFGEAYYDQFPMETICTVKLNRMDNIIGVEQ